MFGTGLMACKVIGGMAGFLLMYMKAREKRTQRCRKRIRFVDICNHELFCIEDGESIELLAGNGDSQVCLCHYLDSHHASIDGKKWEMLDFARQMNERSIIYLPMGE